MAKSNKTGPSSGRKGFNRSAERVINPSRYHDAPGTVVYTAQGGTRVSHQKWVKYDGRLLRNKMLFSAPTQTGLSLFKSKQKTPSFHAIIEVMKGVLFVLNKGLYTAAPEVILLEIAYQFADDRMERWMRQNREELGDLVKLMEIGGSLRSMALLRNWDDDVWNDPILKKEAAKWDKDQRPHTEKEIEDRKDTRSRHQWVRMARQILRVAEAANAARANIRKPPGEIDVLLDKKTMTDADVDQVAHDE